MILAICISFQAKQMIRHVAQSLVHWKMSLHHYSPAPPQSEPVWMPPPLIEAFFLYSMVTGKSPYCHEGRLSSQCSMNMAWGHMSHLFMQLIFACRIPLSLVLFIYLFIIFPTITPFHECKFLENNILTILSTSASAKSWLLLNTYLFN